jgi:hypothetical protein
MRQKIDVLRKKTKYDLVEKMSYAARLQALYPAQSCGNASEGRSRLSRYRFASSGRQKAIRRDETVFEHLPRRRVADIDQLDDVLLGYQPVDEVGFG